MVPSLKFMFITSRLCGCLTNCSLEATISLAGSSWTGLSAFCFHLVDESRYSKAGGVAHEQSRSFCMSNITHFAYFGSSRVFRKQESRLYSPRLLPRNSSLGAKFGGPQFERISISVWQSRAGVEIHEAATLLILW